MNKDDKSKIEIDFKEDESQLEDNKNMQKKVTFNKSPQIFSSKNKIESKKSSSSKGVIELKSTARKSKEFNLVNLNKKNEIGSANSFNKISKKK